MFLQPNDAIVFTGDSITDAGRNRQGKGMDGLGGGYAMMAAALLSARFPDWNLRFENSGIGGNRLSDLEARLETDVLAHAPTIVSILIGINDTWRRYDSNDPSPFDDFAASYQRVASAIQKSGARLLILEPFVLPVPDDRRAWREDLDPRIHICRDIAREFGALYLPLDGLFAAAATRRDAAFWLPDGVHPTLAGHALIAQNWIDAVTA